MNITVEDLNNLEQSNIKKLTYIIKELGGQPYRYRLKQDLINYINILIKKTINNIKYIHPSIISENITKKIKDIYDSKIELIKKEKEKEINMLRNKITVLQNEKNSLVDNLRNKITVLQNEKTVLQNEKKTLQNDNKYLNEVSWALDDENISLTDNYNNLLKSKSLCVTDELRELSELILNKSTSNEIPEGTALELNNKLLEIYKKSKYGSVETYHEQEQVGVVDLDNPIIN